jgi:2-polyprenyl-3-methyl-5-hydroxy-6-metoxy-1,4-benzoquinol methylase
VPRASEPEFTPRQQRERDYYEKFALCCKDRTVSLAPISGREKRPWNSYWRLYEHAMSEFKKGRRLLDFGCGWGTNTIAFAKIGYMVDAVDISEANVAHVHKLAVEHGVLDRVSTKVGAVESLQYSDDTFDVIAGVDILHHVDISRAMRECRRVLKPGGLAIFREPLYSVVFDPIRNWGPVRRLVPNTRSIERHITEDERKLEPSDLALIREVFPDSSVEYMRILSRMQRFFPRLSDLLERIDWRLSGVPGACLASGTGVLRLRKPG